MIDIEKGVPTVLDSNLHPADMMWLLQHNLNAGPYISKSRRMDAANPTLDINDVPIYVVRHLNRHGYDVTMDAIHWAKQLQFAVDPEYIRPLLVQGGWAMDEIMQMTDDVLAGVVLWVACTEFYNVWAEKPGPYVHTFDPRSKPNVADSPLLHSSER